MDDDEMTYSKALKVMKLRHPVTPEGVRVRYRELARERHPDAGGSEAGMAELNEAKELLDKIGPDGRFRVGGAGGTVREGWAGMNPFAGAVGGRVRDGGGGMSEADRVYNFGLEASVVKLREMAVKLELAVGRGMVVEDTQAIGMFVDLAIVEILKLRKGQ